MEHELTTQSQLSPQPLDRPGRVLVVDDEPSALEPLAVRLRLHGFDVVCTGFGCEAISLARDIHPDVILLDLCLPDLDGLAVCQNLAADPSTSDIPVIVVSGLELPDAVRQCRAAGGTYYLRKPYDMNVVLLLVSQAVADHRLWHSPPSD